jgi:hypothetical protein
MSPEIGGWNPALVFGVAVTAAVVVICWMWPRPKRPKRPTNFARDFALTFVVMGIIIWVPVLAWRFGWVSSGGAVVIAIGIAVVTLIVVKAIRRQ